MNKKMAGTVAAGLFNAVSFAGASFIFSKFSHSSYAKEMKRHDLAIEKLNKEKEEFYQHEVQKRDRIAKLRQEQQDAEEDIHSTNEYLQSFKDQIENLQKQKEQEPTLDYKPGKEFSKYILAMNVFLAGLTGYGVFLLL